MAAFDKVLKLVALLLACASGTLSAAPSISTRTIGDIRYRRQSVNFRLEAIQPAGAAVIYDDNVGSRQRLLTSDGRLTQLNSPGIGNALFDKYVWNPSAKAAYVLGAKLGQLSVADRRFVILRNQPAFLRDIDYVARWGAIVVSGADGLYVAGSDRLVPLPSGGPRLSDVTRVKDLPRFHALFLETIDQRIFLRSDDGALHALGKFAAREYTYQVVELRNSPAIQIWGGGSVAHVAMAKGHDGVWRPQGYTWYRLGGHSPGLNGYVPQLDAMVVRPFTWKTAFDQWFDRSGLYKVTGAGLVPIIGWAQHVQGSSTLTNLPSLGFSLYEPNKFGDGARSIYRLGADGLLVPEKRLAPLGRHSNIREIEGTGQIIATTNMGNWRWDGSGTPVRLNDLGFANGYAMPLTNEVLLPGAGHALLLNRNGATLRLPAEAGGGQVFQVSPDRWFRFGKEIVEVRLHRR